MKVAKKADKKFKKKVFAKFINVSNGPTAAANSPNGFKWLKLKQLKRFQSEFHSSESRESAQ